MKKVTRLVWSLVLMVSAVLISSGVQAQTTLLSEGFNGTTIPTGWTQVNELGSVNWAFGVVGGYSSQPATTHSGAYNTRLYNSSDVRTLLVTPSMNFGTNTYATLSFWHTQAYWAGDQDTLSIVYRTSPTNPWIRIAGYQNSITAWTQETITLPNVNATYQIAFRGYATYGYGVCLDDVLVLGMTPQIAPPPTVTIGTGTLTTGNYPYNTYYMDNRTQMIYLASELTAAGASAGNITNFGLNIAAASSYLMNGFTIKMATTTATTLSGFTTPTAWTTVYATNMTITTIGWQNILLTTPFTWNGTSNILMEICFDNSGYGTANTVYCTATADNKTAYRYQDVSTGGGCTLTGESTTLNRPNAKFSFAPGATGMFMGHVTNCLTGAPVANATLNILGNNFTTDATGFYLIQIGTGTYNVTFSAAGFINKTAPVTVTAGNTATLDVCLDPIPAVINGIVTNSANGQPLNGVKISFDNVATHWAYTNATGAYSINIPGGGTVNLKASKPGFEDKTINGIVTVSPNTYTQNIALDEALNVPSNVVAALNTAQTQVNITWGLPIGNYLLSYDDGIAENFTVWASAGNMNGVKFTPLAYPVTLTATRINIGQPSNYPTGANPIKPFKVAVYDASGPGGAPGVAIVPAFEVNPQNFGWNEFTITPTTINAGSFYVVMIQGGVPPNAAGLAIDTTTQQLRSYSKFGTSPWIPASGNFMIRATVTGTGGPLMAAKAPTGNTVTATAVPGAIYQTKPGTVTGVEGVVTVTTEGDNLEGLTGYQVYRLLQGQEGNLPSTWTSIGTPTATNIVDPSWPSLPCGPYRWAVTAIYTNNRVSTAAFSNVIGKCWTANVTVNIDLSCDSLTPAGTKVVLRNLAYPDTVYTKISDATGVVVFNNVWKGTYSLNVIKFQFTTNVTPSLLVMSDVTVNTTLLQIKNAPYGMDVNDRSLWATWNAPKTSVMLLNETWSSGSFATNQWTIAGGSNWIMSGTVGNPAPSAEFYYSPQVTNYSQTLTSKTMVGQNSPVLNLNYDVFLNNYGTTTLEQLAVELWDGATWHLLKNYDNSSGADIPWTSETIDISAYTSSTFQVRFRAYGGDSYNIDNWNVDNISVEASTGSATDPCLIGYNVYLNNILSAFTTDTSYRIPPSQVHYGTTYNACVLAIYGSGYSTTSCDAFTCKFLYPPTNLEGQAIEDAAYITWEKPVISDEIPDNSDAIRPRTNMPIPTSEYSPTVSNGAVTESPLAIWDTQFAWPVSTAGIPNGQVGVEIKDQNIFTSVWSGGPAWFAKYTLTGSLVEVFDIPGATAVRDLASDGTYFYGAAAATSLYKMDFAAHTLAATITAATAVRHIAYDPTADGGNGGFWCGDWSTMALIKMNGSLIANTTIGTAAAYGDAFDNASTGGPFIWVHSQDGTPSLTLTQYKINGTALAATGVSHIVGTSVPGITTAAIAGGLCSGAVNGKFCLIGAAQDATNTIFALELSSNVPNPSGGTPQGLIGYNVYRDDVFRHYVPHPDTLQYYDMNLDPNTYCYDVSAKYDLTTYGFPGQFDESLVANSGPACVTINYGRPIPFFEPWTTGNFSFNEWTTSGGNWSVNSGFGNPAPTADFTWQPILHNYEQSIVTPILTAAAWTCAELWLDFDLKLIDRNQTGDEKLVVEVFSNGNWAQKAEFKNEGSLDWTAEHIDLKAYQGKAFKIRFKATGVNSDDILHWYVDNVHVYGVCKPPIDLGAVQSHQTTTLSWSAPECPTAGTLMNFIYDDGGWENGWRYNPGYLGWFGNYFPIDAAMTGVLKEFQVYFVDNGTGAAFNMSLDVFDGAQTMVGSSAAFMAGTPDVWITVPVNDIPFSGPFYGMMKWDNLTGNSYYLATDEDGPNVGLNLDYQYDGTAFSNTGTPCVFLMRATALVNGELKTFTIQNGKVRTVTTANSNANSIDKSGDSGNHSVMGVSSLADSSTFIGYNVYRTDETGAGTFTKLNAAPVTALTYVDTYAATLENGTFKYYVTSLFDDSSTGLPLCESNSDTITVVFPAVGINDLNAGSISIYPNPATDFVNVNSTSRINSVEVLNFLGQTVYTNNKVNATATKINVQGLNSGVYFVKVNTVAGTKTTKVTVTR